ncbi:hypothetical protein [Rummeliibacillus sp. POC4]|uniref:hypothetical protein n=1 Tax=Rummeliibacillus sp. POC4 TaxID=2305899 RepID=UPI000E6608C8|nr:hypothetical protein [Rummeliibacillus sp. POC4]RIJ63621.1 hypothetical protein D1606_14165 [Rummeliibacillus sp. POC4]
MTVKGFMEDWDGEIILSDTHNFKDDKDFIKQAEDYVKTTRGYKVPVLPPTLLEIVYNGEQEECWASKSYAMKTGFDGETLTVYRSDLDWDNAET